MKIFGKAPKKSNLGIKGLRAAYWNLTPKELTEITLNAGQGELTSTGALSIKTGKFTGRSPKDRFIVKDDVTREVVDWGDINIAFDEDRFDQLHQKMLNYLKNKEVYVRDVYACSVNEFKLNVRVINEFAWSNHFASNMLNNLKEEEIADFIPEWQLINVPGFDADPTVDGTRQENFAIINFTKKIILIGGTGYTGEIKKGIFSVLNFVLPVEHNVLSMHCSANVGRRGDTAVFFGLSGTGKTTLSADPNRMLIGDDEHGWYENTIFNFEGGCYAKCIDLSKEKEPDIWNAIKTGAILENIIFKEGTNELDFTRSDITENTRVSYPLEYIDNLAEGAKGDNIKNIFFLTADAFGVLPPISKLDKEQAMYHFISGYTAKVAGTEDGINEPTTTFSSCYGAPFLPLHPMKYAEMLGEKMEESNVNVWLINTGWTGGPYGIGERVNLKYTRAMINAALEGWLDNVEYVTHKIFGLKIPIECPNVPGEVLIPKETWKDREEYDKKALFLQQQFKENYKSIKK